MCIRDRSALVALASWANGTVACDYTVDLERLGLDPASVSVARAPAIPASPVEGFHFQDEAEFDVVRGKVITGISLPPQRAVLFELSK